MPRPVRNVEYDDNKPWLTNSRNQAVASGSLQTPEGDVDGVNAEFVFTSPPKFVTYQGIIQDLTDDYTLVGSTVTFVVSPVSGTVKGLVST
jgi:hypothetical protein